MNLHDFLTAFDGCIDIFLEGYDFCPASTECSPSGRDMFTKKGAERFSLFLNAKVVSISINPCERESYLNIRLSQHDEFLQKSEEQIMGEFGFFLTAMAGYCNDSDYKKWFRED